MSKLTSQKIDFSKWYNEVVLAAGLAEYSDIKGCMVIKPYGYAIWENLQHIIDKKIKALGVENVYLPLFIPESYFKLEAEHVEGFAPEVAWVTHAGGKKLKERLAIRPTSETIMYRTFAKWISSYRDLPLKVNQWANIVRWEMRTRLFLRTTEFLWQEGHTLHASQKEADNMVNSVLSLYASIARDYLAIDVLAGIKSDAEKFAGAVYTKSIEAMMRDGKALQMGTSHSLGQNFARTFNIQFLDRDSKEKIPYPTSWGVSTRLIGGLIMAHGDDKGLIIPPEIAPIQLIIIPIWKNGSEKSIIVKYISKIEEKIKNVKYKIDWDETKSIGWKFNEWELRGVPLRLEVGPKDEEKKQVVLVRRDNSQKSFVKIEGLNLTIKSLLKSIQKDLFEENSKFLKKNIKIFDDYSKFKDEIKKHNFFALVNWCGDKACEEKIKIDTKATTRVLCKKSKMGRCLVCGKKTNQQVYLAKAY